MIVHSELLYGVEKSTRKNKNSAKLNEFLMPFEIVPYTERMSGIYAEIRAKSTGDGSIVGPADG